MKTNEELSVAEGKQIQQDDLDNWATVLKPEVFAEIEAVVRQHAKDNEYKTGYDVPRGNSISNLVDNYANGYQLAII